MSKRKDLVAVIGVVVLLLSLSIPMMQCAPAAEEEMVPPPEEEVTPLPEEEATPPPEEEEIKYGGRLNVAWGAGEGLENLRCGTAWVYTAMGCCFYPLIYDKLGIMEPTPDYEILPRLATSWETEDGQTWTFHIRDDATFHDGIPVTAEDVAFTLEYLPKADPVWASTDTVCESIEVIDDYTVQFTLKAPIGGPSPAAYWLPIFPKHIFEPYKDNMSAYPNDEAIGSGPFKLKEFKPSEYIWFEANKDYWGERPYVDEVVYRVYGSSDALYMALKSGEADMIGLSGCSALVVDELEAEENLKVIKSPGIGQYWLSFNLHKDGPIQDLNVRKAIMHAIDRDRMIDLVALGYAQKCDSWVYPELPEYNPNLPQYDYDVDEAKVILDQAGYIDNDGDGIRNDPATGKNMEFDLLVAATWTSAVKMATLLKEQLTEIGIAVNMLALDQDTYYAFLYTPQGDLYDIGFSMEAAGPLGAWIWDFGRSYEAGGGWNTSYYYNPEFDEALVKMNSERDLEKRNEYIYEMQMMIAEDLPYGFLMRVDVLDPVSTRFEGYVQTMGGLSPWTSQWTFYKVHLK